MNPTDEDINVIITHPGLRHFRTVPEASHSDRMLYEVSVVLHDRMTMTINGDFAYVITTAAQLIRDKEGKQ